jgi:protein tyrosine phosphatase (PTP) superfamily phosphohydrolase (DUF442 family)
LLGSGGQPTDEGFRQLAQKGYQAVINFRTPAEDGVDLAAEERLVAGLGMQYFGIPISQKEMQEEKALRFLKIMDDLKGQKVFLHCASGVRAGTFVFLDLVLREGIEETSAEETAARAGLTSETWRKFARSVVEHQKK